MNSGLEAGNLCHYDSLGGIPAEYEYEYQVIINYKIPKNKYCA
jgi:hypothetical protein